MTRYLIACGAVLFSTLYFTVQGEYLTAAVFAALGMVISLKPNKFIKK